MFSSIMNDLEVKAKKIADDVLEGRMVGLGYSADLEGLLLLIRDYCLPSLGAEETEKRNQLVSFLGTIYENKRYASYDGIKTPEWVADFESLIKRIGDEGLEKQDIQITAKDAYSLRCYVELERLFEKESQDIYNIEEIIKLRAAFINGHYKSMEFSKELTNFPTMSLYSLYYYRDKEDIDCLIEDKYFDNLIGMCKEEQDKIKKFVFLATSLMSTETVEVANQFDVKIFDNALERINNFKNNFLGFKRRYLIQAEEELNKVQYKKLIKLESEYSKIVPEKLIVQVANHDSKIGHARIGFLYKNGNIKWYGFSMDESDPSLFSGHGLVSEEKITYKNCIEKTFHISSEQYYKIMNFIEEKIKKKDNYYNANYSNCISFVDCILSVADIPSKVADLFSDEELKGAGIGYKFIEYLRTPDLEGINIKKTACKEGLLDEKTCDEVIGNSMRTFK